MISMLKTGALALAVVTSVPAAAAVVDISSTAQAGLTSANAVVLMLGAGTYSATPIVGTYTAFTRFSSVNGCDAAGAACVTGFEHSYKIDIDGVVTGYGGNDGNGGLGPQVTGGYYATQAQAFTFDAETATFTLAAPTSVRFFIFDDILGDNSGGISLNVTAVPEPATWGLMVVGFGLVGFAARRRSGVVAA